MSDGASIDPELWVAANPSMFSTDPPRVPLQGRLNQLAEAELAAEEAATAACAALAAGDRPKAVLHLINALIHTETADTIEDEANQP